MKIFHSPLAAPADAASPADAALRALAALLGKVAAREWVAAQDAHEAESTAPHPAEPREADRQAAREWMAQSIDATEAVVVVEENPDNAEED